MGNQFVFVLLGFVVGLCVMPMMFEKLYIPEEQTFFYAYQTLIGSMIALLAAILTIVYQHYKGKEQKRRVKRHFESELFSFVSEMGVFIFPLEGGFSEKKSFKFYLSQNRIPQLPEIMNSHDLISILNPKDVQDIVMMKKHYQSFTRCINNALNSRPVLNRQEGEADQLFIMQLEFAYASGKMLSDVFDNFSEDLVIEHNADGSWTKSLKPAV